MTYHLRLFGYPALLDSEGRAQPFRTRKQLALLVYLAFEGRVLAVSRDTLVEFFWGDAEELRGRHSLSQALAAIRARLGENAISRGRASVRMDYPLSTDLEGLQHHTSPPDLDRPLQGLDHVGSADFGHWVDVARSRCLWHAREALTDQLRVARSHGDMRRVHERAAELYRVDPLSEAAVCALAEQLLLGGDVGGTQQLLRAHLERAKAAHMGDNPYPRVTRLLSRVERGMIRTPGGELIAPEVRDRGRREVFVGRDAELARLESLWSEARAERLVTCLVTGPAGIGKSSLLQRFATSVASRAATVWEISCQEIGKNIPFAAVSDLFQVVSRDSAFGGTAPEWIAEASRVCPDLRQRYDGVPEPPPAPPESIRLRVAEALVQMLKVFAEDGPILFVIDDVGNIDPASRDVLYVLLRRLDSLPILVVATHQATDGHDLVTIAENTSVGLPWDERIRIDGLSPSEVRQMIASFLAQVDGTPLTHINVLTELAGGNPQLLEILLRDLLDAGKASLVASHVFGRTVNSNWDPPLEMRRAFERQYRGLTRDAIGLLSLLAVAGRRASASDLGKALGIRESRADCAALELLHRGIVRVEEGALAFKSGLHRDFAYVAMSDETREFRHGQIARYLARTCRGQGFARQLEASHHFLQARMAHQAAEAVLSVGDMAIAEGAGREVETALKTILCDNSIRQHDAAQLLLARALSAQGKHRKTLTALTALRTAQLRASERVLESILRAEALHRGRLDNDASVREAVHEALVLIYRATECDIAVISNDRCGETVYDIRCSPVICFVPRQSTIYGMVHGPSRRGSIPSKKEDGEEIS